MNQAAKAMTSTWDELIDLLESMEQLVSRLRIQDPSSVRNDYIMVNIMVELISTLGLVTEKLKHRPSESVLADVFTLLSASQSIL